jgi:hypothetical protein
MLADSRPTTRVDQPSYLRRLFSGHIENTAFDIEISFLHIPPHNRTEKQVVQIHHRCLRNRVPCISQHWGHHVTLLTAFNMFRANLFVAQFCETP